MKEEFKNTINDVTKNVTKKASDAIKKAGETAKKTQESVIKAVDQDGNGKIDIQDIRTV